MKTFTFYYLFRYLCTKKKIAIINTDHYQCPTCVSAFVEILQSLQCKIFQYSFLRQYPMKAQDVFPLCQIQQLAWLCKTVFLLHQNLTQIKHNNDSVHYEWIHLTVIDKTIMLKKWKWKLVFHFFRYPAMNTNVE